MQQKRHSICYTSLSPTNLVKSTINYTTKRSFKHLSDIERGQIYAYYKEGKSPAEIGRLIGRHRSTIKRELERGTITQVKKLNETRVYFDAYYPDAGQRIYQENRSRCRFIKLEHCSTRSIADLEAALLVKARCHSIDSFVHTYKRANPLDVIPSTKTIYSYIHAGLLKVKPIDLPRAVRLKPRSKARGTITKKTLGKSIEERAESINARCEFGDWEIDLVLGAKTKDEPVILTLVERQTRYALSYKLDNKLSKTVNQAVEQLVSKFPIRSITADNGSEFSRLAEIKRIEVYFAHPYSSHERGTNENFNGLLREFLPKGQSFKDLTEEELKSYLSAINLRHRRLLDYQSSQKQFELLQTV